MPSSASTPSIHDVFGEITFEVARLGENVSRRHQDAEKTSCPARCRRPLRLGFSFQVCLLSAVAHPGLHICLFLVICAIARVFAPHSCRPSGCLRQATQPAPTGMCSGLPLSPPLSLPRRILLRPPAHVFMFAGFKRIAPKQDTGMDLNEPWISALGLFNAGKNSEGS